jgi:hypothetical protein
MEKKKDFGPMSKEGPLSHAGLYAYYLVLFRMANLSSDNPGG